MGDLYYSAYHGEEQAGMDPHYESSDDHPSHTSEFVDLKEAWLQIFERKIGE